MTTSLSTPQAGAAFNGEALINAHPQAALIREVQRTAYRAYSRRHKVGLDALSWLGGPCTPMLFACVDDHRQKEHDHCLEAAQRLVAAMRGSVDDRRIVALLLADYPGRNPRVAQLLRSSLQSQG